MPSLVHLVERRHARAALDLADHEVGDVVDFFLGVEAAEAEADGRVRELVADAQRAQHVARLEARAGAGRAAETATSLMAIIMPSPSTKENEMLRLPGRRCCGRAVEEDRVERRW